MMNDMQNGARTIDRTGQQLKGYRLLRALSLGRAAGTYLGEHVQSRAQCLVKVWETHLEAAQVNDFLRQARALSELHHPSIVPLRDANVADLLPFVVMEYVPHVTLQQRSSRGTPQPLTNFLSSLSPIAEALQVAHSKGILHKHVQPANILLDNSQRVLLSNFGIDVIDRNSWQPLIITKEDALESLGYQAPEQLEGRAFPASDQYGLAVVIYEWLTGTLPFRGSYAEIARQQRHAKPASFYQNIVGSSRMVEETLFIALAKEPARRFSGVTRFVEALREADGRSAARMVPAAQNIAIAQPRIDQQFAVSRQGESVPAAAVARQMTIAANIQPQGPVTPAPLPAAQPPATQASPARMPARQSAAPKRGEQQKQSITRRAFMAGLLGVAVVGGGAAWLGFGRNLAGSLPGAGGTPGTVSTPSPAHAARGNIFIYRAHQERVSAVAWSPDGRRIASASDDHFVLICDAQKGHTELTYSGHSGPVLALAWSPDGRYIASGGKDQTVQIWNATTGKLINTYTGHNKQVNAVSWAHQSDLIASGSDDTTVQVWNALTLEPSFKYTGHTLGVLAVAWSPDDTVIASGSWDTTVRAIAAVSSQSFAVGETVINSQAHTAEVYSVAWSPDGTRLASSSADKLVIVHDGQDGKTIFQYAGHTDIVYAVDWSPDGARLASGSADNTAQVWANAQQGVVRQSLFAYAGHTDIVYAVAWSPDSRRLASGSADMTMQVWHLV